MVFITIGYREVLQLELVSFCLYILDWIANIIQVDRIFPASLGVQSTIVTLRNTEKLEFGSTNLIMSGWGL